MQVQFTVHFYVLLKWSELISSGSKLQSIVEQLTVLVHGLFHCITAVVVVAMVVVAFSWKNGGGSSVKLRGACLCSSSSTDTHLRSSEMDSNNSSLAALQGELAGPHRWLMSRVAELEVEKWHWQVPKVQMTSSFHLCSPPHPLVFPAPP